MCRLAVSNSSSVSSETPLIVYRDLAKKIDGRDKAYTCTHTDPPKVCPIVQHTHVFPTGRCNLQSLYLLSANCNCPPPPPFSFTANGDSVTYGLLEGGKWSRLKLETKEKKDPAATIEDISILGAVLSLQLLGVHLLTQTIGCCIMTSFLSQRSREYLNLSGKRRKGELKVLFGEKSLGNPLSL